MNQMHSLSHDPSASESSGAKQTFHMRIPRTTNLWAGLQHFFFEEQILWGAALTRMLLPLAALMPMLMRFPRVRELYSTDGTPVQLYELYGHGPVLPVLPPEIAVALYSLMVFCLICGIIGWRTRLSLATGTTLYVYFNMLDGVGTMTKYTVIAAHLLLLLTISRCGSVWSVDAALRRRRSGGSALLPPVSPIWPVRLMQLLFAFIYFGSAITKIQTEAFFSGQQMRYWMLSNWNYNNPVGEIMAMWSPVLLIGAYLTVIWEILFAFLVWNNRLRLIMLSVGAAFHAMTRLTLGLYIFPAICLSGYLCFVTQEDFLKARHYLRKLGINVGRLFRRMPSIPQVLPSSVTWMAAACLFGVASLEVEYRRDLFGTKRPSGPFPLAEIDREEALKKIGGAQPLREKDKFFSFGLGTVTVGGQLANHRNSFDYGEWLIAECNLNPPHEDMWVECILEDEEGRIIERLGQFITREMLHANFHYLIGNRLTRGRYNMILRSSGREIYRSPFSVTGDPESAALTSGFFSN